MVKPKWGRVVFLILILSGWHLLAISGRYNQALIPSLNSIANTFIDECVNGKLPKAILYSFIAIGKGLLYSLIISGCLVTLSRVNRYLDDLVDFIVTIAHPLPGIAILPLVILWFGIGEKAVLFIIIHSMVWPMVVNIKAEVLKLHQRFERVVKAFNFNLWRRFYYVYFKGSLPAVVTGAKIGWSRGWRAFISAEMVFGVVGHKSGLGWYLFEQRVYMNTSALFSGLIAIIICGVIIEQLLFKQIESLLEKRWT